MPGIPLFWILHVFLCLPNSPCKPVPGIGYPQFKEHRPDQNFPVFSWRCRVNRWLTKMCAHNLGIQQAGISKGRTHTGTLPSAAASHLTVRSFWWNVCFNGLLLSSKIWFHQKDNWPAPFLISAARSSGVIRERTKLVKAAFDIQSSLILGEKQKNKTKTLTFLLHEEIAECQGIT